MFLFFFLLRQNYALDFFRKLLFQTFKFNWAEPYSQTEMNFSLNAAPSHNHSLVTSYLQGWGRLGLRRRRGFCDVGQKNVSLFWQIFFSTVDKISYFSQKVRPQLMHFGLVISQSLQPSESASPLCDQHPVSSGFLFDS